MIVLDTNVISELMRPVPSRQVLTWFSQQSPQVLFVTSVSQAEILYGIAILPAGARRKGLNAAATEVFEEDFAGRILAFDSSAAKEFARLAGERRTKGRPIPASDAQIVAIASAHGAAVATRNTRDFEGCGVGLINPWTFRSNGTT